MKWLWLGYVALVLLAATAARPRPLGHDEAVYAIAGLRLVEGGGAAIDPVPVYRPVGMAALAAPGVLAGGGDVAMRLPLLPFALAYAALVAALARRAFGEAAAAWALALQATSAPWLWRAGELLSDVPSAAALLALLVLVLDDAARPRPRLLAWAGVAACGAAACLIRYGSAPTLAAIYLGAFALMPRRRAALALAALATLALLAPLLAHSTAVTGSPLGIFRVAQAAANRAYAGDGLVYYLTRWPWALAGPVMGAAIALGLGASVSARRSRRGADDGIATLARRLFGVVAVAQMVAVGLVAHGEPRFVFLASSLLAVVGADWLSRRGHPWRRAASALVVAAAIAAPVEVWLRADAAARTRAPLVAAARAVKRHAAGRSCLVFTGSPPQVAWSSRCRTQLNGHELPRASLADAYELSYLISAAGERWRPPPGETLSTPALRLVRLECDTRLDWCVWRGER